MVNVFINVFDHKRWNISATVANIFCVSSASTCSRLWRCGLTQDLGPLVGAVRQRPVRRSVVPSQCDVQLTSERLVIPSCNQPAALKQQQTYTSTHDYQSDCDLLLLPLSSELGLTEGIINNWFPIRWCKVILTEWSTNLLWMFIHVTLTAFLSQISKVWLFKFLLLLLLLLTTQIFIWWLHSCFCHLLKCILKINKINTRLPLQATFPLHLCAEWRARLIPIIMEVVQVSDHTDLDGDVDSIHHHGAVFRCSPSLSAGRAVHGVGDLKNSNDRQLVEGRSVAVQHDPRPCGLTGTHRYYDNTLLS